MLRLKRREASRISGGVSVMVRDFEIEGHCKQSDKIDPYYLLLLISAARNLYTLEQAMGLHENKSYSHRKLVCIRGNGSFRQRIFQGRRARRLKAREKFGDCISCVSFAIRKITSTWSSE